jgi:hypothetical protein
MAGVRRDIGQAGTDESGADHPQRRPRQPRRLDPGPAKVASGGGDANQEGEGEPVESQRVVYEHKVI